MPVTRATAIAFTLPEILHVEHALTTIYAQRLPDRDGYEEFAQRHVRLVDKFRRAKGRLTP